MLMIAKVPQTMQSASFVAMSYSISVVHTASNPIPGMISTCFALARRKQPVVQASCLKSGASFEKHVGFATSCLHYPIDKSITCDDDTKRVLIDVRQVVHRSQRVLPAISSCLCLHSNASCGLAQRCWTRQAVNLRRSINAGWPRVGLLARWSISVIYFSVAQVTDYKKTHAKLY